jgi:hypothetical protein
MCGFGLGLVLRAGGAASEPAELILKEVDIQKTRGERLVMESEWSKRGRRRVVDGRSWVVEAVGECLLGDGEKKK